jgi:hypothetical protein
MNTILNKILVSFVCLLIYLTSFSQTNSGFDGILFATQIMGKHLSSIDDSLFCAEGSNALYSPSSETRCKSFIVKKINGEYLVKLFGKKGKTGDVYKVKKYYHHNLVWQDEKFKYILTKDIQKNFLSISYSVQAKK